MNSNDIISLISKIREKVNRLIISELAAHGVDGLVTSHGDIIFALIHKSKMTMAEIAAKIGKDKSTVTALVDKLVKLGYVKKERDEEDTRIIYVSLTVKGFDLKPVFDEISQKVLKVFYNDISDKEKEVLFQMLNKIYSNF
ncbi:MarR family winged helix-turn-helix transcriptional regulator [Anaerocolumna sp. MB42-C2]|uniref:MarR family winged helix-turn-helix transcriptional regulator n=1 Tax=Anaerocolumna sp. MB42-C2 TaxID=3070997 RepID=UPI0027E09889|nr:MarR family winged helix-turn-helix transcriptional regulator [Anaerocolumna sp. MB42-C2]WMJ89317.1 MarR family winged helix-turn-helix transcriptional regulator [Anaerocolumna sp. MB42-C2]